MGFTCIPLRKLQAKSWRWRMCVTILISGRIMWGHEFRVGWEWPEDLIIPFLITFPQSSLIASTAWCTSQTFFFPLKTDFYNTEDPAYMEKSTRNQGCQGKSFPRWLNALSITCQLLLTKQVPVFLGWWVQNGSYLLNALQHLLFSNNAIFINLFTYILFNSEK